MRTLKDTERATLAHVAPFVAWLFIMHMLGDPAGWKYAVRSAACLALLLWLRPWAGYPRMNFANLPLGVRAGVAVFIIWVLPESALMARWPNLQELYLRYAVMPWGGPRDLTGFGAYAPDVAGWPFTMTRLLGSAFVIAVIEEFFWRGFAYRWVQGRDFRAVDPGRRDILSWLLVSAVFGLEHAEWLAGFAAGLVYGWIYIRTRDIWACCAAHVTTNFLLGVYVLVTGSHQFW